MRPLLFLLTLFLMGLPWIWLVGVPVADAAKVLAGLFLIFWIMKRDRTLTAFSPTVLSLRMFSFLFPNFVLAFLFARISLGRVGLDFTLFLQAIDSLSRVGVPWTSLLGLEWQNFFGHHLDLILWVPALIARLGVAVPHVTVLFHVAAIAWTLTFLRKFCEGRVELILIALLFAFLPIFRHALLWSIHDDIFALPFIAGSWWSWRKQRMTLMSLFLIGALLCKETLGLWVACFALVAFVADRRLIHILFVALGASVFIGYVFLQPMLLGKSFDHISKIASVSQLLDPQMLLEKVLFFGELLWPFFLLFALMRFPLREIFLFLPAAPFLGMIFVSNFPEMWKPLNYYGLIPSLTCLLALIDIAKRNPFELKLAQYGFIVSLAFGTGTLKIGKTVWEAIREPKLHAPVLPAYDRVAISPAAHVKLIAEGKSPLPSQGFVGRAFYFAAKQENPALTVFRQGEEKDFPVDYLLGKKDCRPAGVDERWIYLCP